MAPGNVIPLHRRASRYSASIAAEAWMEVAESARRLVAFTESELSGSWHTGDVSRLRTLQAVHQDATRIVAEGRRMAAWADGATCADGEAQPGHGQAA